MKNFVVLAAAFLVAGCVQPYQQETVYLQKGEEKVQCGPYDTTPLGLVLTGGMSQVQADEKLRTCVEDYQKAKYERTPGP